MHLRTPDLTRVRMTVEIQEPGGKAERVFCKTQAGHDCEDAIDRLVAELHERLWIKAIEDDGDDSDT